jgi:glycerol-3-phosphate dehydrogenase subunit B
LEKSFGCTFAETTAALPSVPGWRLSEAILRYFKSQGYDVLPAEVVGFEGQDRRIQSVTVHYGAERMRLSARQFILASGKFVGGGLQDREGLIREPIFSLPLFLQGRSLGEQGRRALFASSPNTHPPVFGVGVCVNEQGRPLGHRGEVLWDNLFACGRILSGCGVGADGSASAVSLLSSTAII